MKNNITAFPNSFRYLHNRGKTIHGHVSGAGDCETVMSAAAQSPAGVTERGKDVLGTLPVAWAWVMECGAGDVEEQV